MKEYISQMSKLYLILAAGVGMIVTLTACAGADKVSVRIQDEYNIDGNTETEAAFDFDEDYSTVENVTPDIEDSPIMTAETEPALYEYDYTEKDVVSFNPNDAFSYCANIKCVYSDDNKVTLGLDFANGIPASDDGNVYMFEVSTFEDETLTNKTPVTSARIRRKVMLETDYKTRYLFSRFVPALLLDGEYVPIADGQYISNPESLADVVTEYPQLDSKKGLLLDANTIDTDLLYDLNVKRVVYNIPLSFIIGESENPACPTIEFEYDGKTYYFDGYMCAGFDSLFAYLSEHGFHSTAILLNDWNTEYPEIIHPLARKKTGMSQYYAFNTEEEDGVRLMEATALFLAKRYSGGDYGLVHDWVIANEVNQQKMWNYMDTSDLNYYTESFEQSFRTFYNAIKSNYSNARVYFSIDHDWNDNFGNNRIFFNGRDMLYTFDEVAKKHGNYDWGLSIHPYPNPLTKVRFWNGEFDKSEETKVITPMNLTALTNFMMKDDMLDTKGNVRNIGVTELGFSSKYGEKLHAAAFAYCYYIIEDNEHIDSFLMNRQTDDAEALKSGLALGIYNNDYSAKYIAEVFANIDSEKGKEFIPEMLEVIEADSLEDALNRAK